MAIVLPFNLTDGTLADAVQVMANFNKLVTEIEGVSAAAAGTDVYQAGAVASTDWTSACTIVGGTGVLSWTSAGGAAWLPGPVSGLVRTFTTVQEWKALKPPVLPGPAGYLNVGIELTASGAAATVSVVSGAEQVSEALALANPPAVSANKVRARNVVILNTAGVYSIVKEIDRRPWAMGAIPAPTLITHSENTTVKAQNGDMIFCTFVGTQIVSLPTPTLNASIAVFASSETTVTLNASVGSISGDFVGGPASVTLTPRQHVLLRSEGTNWLIVAGEPKREQEYSGTISKTKAEMETGVEVSASRPGYIIFKAGATEGLTIGGKAILVGTNGVPYYVPPGQKVKNTGPATSEYQTFLL